MDEIEVIKHLTDDQKNRTMLLEKLFESDGWKILHQYLTHNAEQSLLRKLNAQNWDDNRVAHGEALAYNVLAGIEQSTAEEFANLAEQARDQQSLAEEDADYGLD